MYHLIRDGQSAGIGISEVEGEHSLDVIVESYPVRLVEAVDLKLVLVFVGWYSLLSEILVKVSAHTGHCLEDYPVEENHEHYQNNGVKDSFD